MAGAEKARVSIDQALTRKVGEKRIEMIDDLLDVLEQDEEKKWNPATVSMILPEDVSYIVLENGIPVGKWIPETKTYLPF